MAVHFNTKHGHSRSGRQTPEYFAWRNMLNRCYNEGVDSFPLYGGRGIAVCERWQGERGFENFLADMGPRPSAQHSIDRRESDGNYEPDNCRWATRIEQARNRRTVKLTIAIVAEIRAAYSGGESQTSIAGRVGVSQAMISKVVRNELWVQS